MTRLHIANRAQLDQWLEDNCCFEDGVFVGLSPEPRTDGCPAEIALTLAVPTGGSYLAGKLQTLRVSELHATGVSVWSISSPNSIAPGHCMEGVSILQDSNGLGLECDVPGMLRLECDSITIRVTERKEKNGPSISSKTVLVDVRGRPCPSPKEWVEWCQQVGLDVAWRYWAGDAKKPEEVPADYTGWFLQMSHRMSSVDGGLFFHSCVLAEDGFRLQLENYHDDMDTLWRAVGMILGRLPNVVIQTGNCRMSGEQWSRYLEVGTLPPM